ncbi:PAS domain S-box protein [Amphritea sp. 2_MG-2023]|uniref:PAS domain S-box protein n=1 Tax=Amphritea TaxID=515417 RepID=UPI001C065A87|nr:MULTISPECIES: PAS domain S-box protein [Amphritea]MBU2965650.1 PAS domain S-box protein [Amphritea atlantica]MDO6417206.1 PAS domain S-box protein [Amphritea sp. 2_MG-2023]
MKTTDRHKPAPEVLMSPAEVERNRLLAEMAEQSTDMISRHSPDDWCFIDVSPAVTHLLGYSVDEIVGMSAYELYHPDDVENFKRRAPSVSYERGLYTHTYRFRCKDGHYTWLESTSRTIRDPHTDELKEILVVSRDVSQRINTEQANRRLARVLEHSSDLVAFVTPDHRVSQLNEAARDALGLEVDGSDLPLNRLFTPDSYAVLQQQALPQARDQGSWRGEAQMFSRRQQRAIPVMLEVLAHRTLDNQLEYFSTVARDMTAIKQAEAKQQQYQQEIDHAARLITMGEMATGLAHEINQPLTAVVNYVRGIQRRLQTDRESALEAIAQPLEKIANTALRAGEIVRQMMDFTRKSEPERELLSLTTLVNDLIGFCASAAKRHHVLLENNLSVVLPEVYADRIQLEQILLNLLLNGIEACHREDHQSPLKVWLEASTDQAGQVIISVLDQGPGLPADPEQLFEQFFTTKADGLGMGLAISRTLIERHGGQLQAENRPAGGAKFSFTLPTAE